MEKRHWSHYFLISLMLCFAASGFSIAADPKSALDSPEDSVPPGIDMQKKGAKLLEQNGEISQTSFAGDSARAATPLTVNQSHKALTPSNRAPGVETAPAPIPLQSTKTIDLELVGTVISDNSEMTFAVINEPSAKKQRVYRVGDRVGQKALLKKIMRNRVIIDTGNGDVMISILHRGSSPVSSMAPAPLTAMNDPEPAQQTSEETPEDLRSSRARTLRVSLNRQEVEDSLSDLGQLVDQLQLSPMTTNDRRDGIEITTIPSGSILSKMGLGDRDTIMAVNDEEISSPDQVSAFLESLKQGGDFVVRAKIRGNGWVRVRRLLLEVK